MTALLQEAIREITALPNDEQDFVARLVLDTVRDAQRWDAQFAASKDVLEELFDEAMQEYQKSRRNAPYFRPRNSRGVMPVAARKTRAK